MEKIKAIFTSFRITFEAHIIDYLSAFDIVLKLNSVALVRKLTIPTERPPLNGEVSANFCGYRVSRGERNGSPRTLISVF
jgi:hypothetical protein